MIVSLTGTLIDISLTHVTLDVHGVGYELGVSATCAACLPARGTTDVTLLCRLIVREDDMSLYGFVDAAERTLFDRLRAISGVGPKMALSILSTYTAAQLGRVVASEDMSALKAISGVGAKTASRLMIELKSIYEKDAYLKGLDVQTVDVAAPVNTSNSVVQDTEAALLAMGFTSQEAALALEGLDKDCLVSPEKALPEALKRLGGGVF